MWTLPIKVTGFPLKNLFQFTDGGWGSVGFTSGIRRFVYLFPKVHPGFVLPLPAAPHHPGGRILSLQQSLL